MVDVDIYLLGKNLLNIINQLEIEGNKLSNLNIKRNNIDEILLKVKIAKKENRNFIWYQRGLTNYEIDILNTHGLNIWIPKRGINYGKTWPGYKISWKFEDLLKGGYCD